ncbi:hypothetical protein ACUH9Y_06480 [Dermabacteraceae bacterium P13115]
MNLKRIIAATLLSAGSLGLLAGCSSHSGNAEAYACHQGADSPEAAVAQFVEGLRSDGGKPACSMVMKEDGWDLNDPVAKSLVERIAELGGSPREEVEVMLNPVSPTHQALVFTADTGRPLLLLDPVQDGRTGKYFVRWWQDSLASEVNVPEYMLAELAKRTQK